MKKLNVRLILILLGIALAVGISVPVVHSWQVQRNSETLLTQSDKALAEGNLPKAANLRAKYLQLHEKDTEQRAELALLRLKIFQADPTNATYGGAQSALQDAVTGDPENLKLRRGLIDLQMQVNDRGRALQNLNTYIKQLTDKGQKVEPDVEVMLGICLSKTNELEKAEKILGEAVGYDRTTRQFNSGKAKAPKNIDAYIGLAQQYASQALTAADGNRVIDRMVAMNPDNYKAYLARAQYVEQNMGLRAEGSLARVDADLLKAAEIAPNEKIVIHYVTNRAMLLRKFAEAEKLALDGAKKFPADLFLLQNLIRATIYQGQLDRALDYVDKALVVQSDSHELLTLRTQVLLEQARRDEKKIAAAAEQLEKMRVHPRASRDMLLFFDARLAMLKKEWAFAAKTLEQVRNRFPKGSFETLESNQFLQECYAQLGEFDRQLDAVDRSMEQGSDTPASRLRRAQLSFQLGQIEKAQDDLAVLDRIAGDYKYKDLDWMLLSLRVKIAEQLKLASDKRDWKQVDELSEKIMALPDLNANAKDNLALDLLRAKEDTEKYNAALAKMKEKNPDSPSVWLQELERVGREKGAQAALDLIAEQEKKQGPSANLRLRKIGWTSQLGAGAVEKLKALEPADADKFNKDERAALWFQLGEIYLTLGDPADARRAWGRAMELSPEDLRMRMRAFDVALDSRDEKWCLELFEEIKKMVGSESTTLKYCQARLWLLQVGLETAEKDALAKATALVKEAREERPNWQQLAQLEGDLAQANGDLELAVSIYDKSLSLGPPSLPVVRALVTYYVSVGKVAEAEKVLAKLNTAALSKIDDRLLSQLKLAKGQVAEALEIAARGVKEKPEDPTSHWWHYQLLNQAKKYEEAEAAIRKAVELNPGSIDYRLDLVRFLLTRDKLAEAKQAMQAAQLALSQNVVSLYLAKSHEMLVEKVATNEDKYAHLQQARQSYEAALAASPDNLGLMRTLAEFYLRYNNIVDGREMLRRIAAKGKPKSANQNPAVMWARRTMAQLLGRTNSFPDYIEAIRLIDENTAEGGKASLDDLTLKVSLSAARGDSVSIDNALTLLTQARDERTLTPDLRLVLGQLYDRTGRWTEARQVMNSLMADFPKNSVYMAAYFDMLLRRGETSEVARNIENLPPKSLEYVKIKSKLLVAQKKNSEAAKLLTDLIPQPLPANQAGVLLEIARYMTELRLYDDAEKLYLTLAQKFPEATFDLADFYGRKGDLDKCFKICEEIRVKSAAQPGLQGRVIERITDIATRALAIHRDRLTGDSAYHKTTDEWFDKGLQLLPDSSQLLSQRGNFAELKGNVQETIGWYRKFLAMKNTNPTDKARIQNNLAYSLIMTEQGADEALQLINESIAILGPMPDLLDTRAMVYLANKDTSRAIADLIAAISSSTGDKPIYHLHMAEAYRQSLRNNDAIDSLRKAKEKGIDKTDLSPRERKLYESLRTELKVL